MASANIHMQPNASRLPDFIAVGPPRTATTWLDRTLRGHVGLPDQTKETHFFARNYGRGLHWYARHFSDCAAEPVVGEICASYFENARARERICVHLPHCRIVCTLRDPVERLYSYYKLMRHNGKTEASFEEAVGRYRQMLDSSRYAFHIREWQLRFGADNVLVVLNDDLTFDSQSYLDQITDFIGIPTIPLRASTGARKGENTIAVAPRSARLARNARQLRSWLGAHRLYRTRRLLTRIGVWRLCFEGGEEFAPLDPGLRSRLQDILRPDVEALEELLNRKLPWWKASIATTERVSGTTECQEQRRCL
jgi:sulfotransferase family protein